MKILKESAGFEIVTPRDVLKDQLLIIETQGRISHWSETGPITMETAMRFVKTRMYEDHHISVLEHGNMSVKFKGISIGMTRENNRHRIVALTERSTRYVDYARGREDLDRFQLRFVLPSDMDESEAIDIGNGQTMTPKEYLELGERFYRGVRKTGYKPDSARQFLWIGTESEEGETTNFRQWRHIFALRTARPAHWEIRSVMGKLLEEVQGIVPVVFDDFHVRGKCRMGVNYYGYKVKDE